MDQLCPKRIFQVVNKKSEYHHWIFHIQIRLATKFQLNAIRWHFGPNLSKKCIFGRKRKKWISPFNSPYWNYLRIKFNLKLTIFFILDQICPERPFLMENEKSEQHHWIPHIRISLATKFSLKLTISTFWTKFPQKGRLWLKTKKVNSIIEFCIFE